MTKIAISALDANGLDAQVGQQAVQSVESVENPYYANHQPGEVPGFINGLGAQVMLSGGMGGRAVAFFKQFGIEPATGARGTVRAALTQYLGGNLTGAAPCAESVEHGHDS